MKTHTVGAGKFKTHCLQFLDEINEKHIELIITKRGKAVAKLVAVDTKPISLYGCLEGTVVILGDIVSSTHEAWDADSND